MCQKQREIILKKYADKSKSELANRGIVFKTTSSGSELSVAKNFTATLKPREYLTK